MGSNEQSSVIETRGEGQKNNNSRRHRRGLINPFNYWQLQQLFKIKWINRQINDKFKKGDGLARLEEKKKKVAIRSNELIQSSMQEDDDDDSNWRQTSSGAMTRQFVYDGCTCSTPSLFPCSTKYLGGM